MAIRYTGAVDEAGSGAVSSANELKQVFENLMTRARGICGEGWTGAASEAFGQAQQKWNVQAEHLAGAHTQVGQRTQQASQNAFGADNKGAGLFNV